jgi:hypothetical protein
VSWSTSIDTSIHDPASKRFLNLVAALNDQLRHDGCAVVRGFVRTRSLDELAQQADWVVTRGHRNFSRAGPYRTRDDAMLPAKHPVCRFFERSNAFVPVHNFGAGSSLRALYEGPFFAPFI